MSATPNDSSREPLRAPPQRHAVGWYLKHLVGVGMVCAMAARVLTLTGAWDTATAAIVIAGGTLVLLATTSKWLARAFAVRKQVGGEATTLIRHRNLGHVIHAIPQSTLAGADLQGLDLERANLYAANLRGANLKYARLKDACLEGADLRGANLCCADLRWANLTYSDLRGADLRGADLRARQGVNLLEGARMAGVCCDGGTLWPPSFNVKRLTPPPGEVSPSEMSPGRGDEVTGDGPDGT